MLPIDIYHEILRESLCKNISPTALSLVCSLFHDIVQQVLYTYLRFKSRSQLILFTLTYRTNSTKIPLPPRRIGLDILGNDSHLVFADLYDLFSGCFSDPLFHGANVDESGRLLLDELSLRLNSHAFDRKLDMIYTSLSLIRFRWTGPDPPHHFSIAIVPPAIPRLFSALSRYTCLEDLELSHLAIGVDTASQLPVIPSLRRVHLGQIILLSPLMIARLILHPATSELETVTLVDAYRESIWGPRLRGIDVERAAEALTQTGAEDVKNSSLLDVEHAKTLIKTKLRCEAKTERIIGGDRVDAGILI
ncbi:hypothetical protein CPB83DRAFT_898471 [Crepidotus variabilis]|uniref:F-box domain-containing protein n=1 Tax=Crepidotus variabilis TaxID=179855 RepID=A0A9P6E7H2_9AGAR|nr:hypothetical protein CPB83DRAFT_898471 [Crepidotus variabilis]